MSGMSSAASIEVLDQGRGDVMMVLQGLDYWIWATANSESLAKYFGLGEPSPEVVVDFLISEDRKGALLGPYSRAQSRSLMLIWQTARARSSARRVQSIT